MKAVKKTAKVIKTCLRIIGNTFLTFFGLGAVFILTVYGVYIATELTNFVFRSDVREIGSDFSIFQWWHENWWLALIWIIIAVSLWYVWLSVVFAKKEEK